MPRAARSRRRSPVDLALREVARAAGRARRLRVRRRTRRATVVRRTRALGAAAVVASAALLGEELVRLRRPGEPPGELARETAATLAEGYRAGSANETALLNLFLAFGTTFGAVRGVTHLIHTGRQRGPMGNVVIGRRHIHHFVPGILVALLSGGASIAMRHEQLDQWLAIPFGAGAALVLDESALLLALEDVYWSDEGIVSVHVTLGTTALLAAIALTVRSLRRGERLRYVAAE